MFKQANVEHFISEETYTSNVLGYVCFQELEVHSWECDIGNTTISRLFQDFKNYFQIFFVHRNVVTRDFSHSYSHVQRGEIQHSHENKSQLTITFHYNSHLFLFSFFIIIN